MIQQLFDKRYAKLFGEHEALKRKVTELEDALYAVGCKNEYLNELVEAHEDMEPSVSIDFTRFKAVSIERVEQGGEPITSVSYFSAAGLQEMFFYTTFAQHEELVKEFNAVVKGAADDDS